MLRRHRLPAPWVPGIAVACALAATSSGFASDAVDITVLADSAHGTVIQYTFDDFDIETVSIDGVDHWLISLGTESRVMIAGDPALPDVSRSIIVPDDACLEVRVLDRSFYEIEGIDIAPSKGSILRTVDPATVPWTFGPAYDTDAIYPTEEATLRDPYIMRDHRGVVVTVNPFRYNPVTRVLRVYTDLVIEVAPVGPGEVNVLDRDRPRELSRAFDGLYRSQFLNYLPPRYNPLDEVGDLLIIAHDPWLANIEPLAMHKESHGINTTVVPISTIGNTTTAIKAHIQQVYDTTDLAFVLLVGDAVHVKTPYSAGGASDPSYAKLAGNDDYPDIMVGRFSAQTAADVDTQVERTIEYELLPAPQQDWYWKGMGIASNQGPGDDGEYDNQHMNNIRAVLLASGYTLVDQIYDPSGTVTMVKNGLNDGRGIVNYCGHGWPQGWSTSGFDSGDVNALVNDNMLPFIVSVACNNGEFNNYTTCFAEAFLRATHNGEPTGAIGVYMSSISQYWNEPMEAQDEFNALVCDDTAPYLCYGALCYAGSCAMMDDYGNSGVDMYDTWHLFGDPSLLVIGEVQDCFGDLNGDCVVDGADLGLLLGAWGPCTQQPCAADLDKDRDVDGADLGLLLGAWG